MNADTGQTERMNQGVSLVTGGASTEPYGAASSIAMAWTGGGAGTQSALVATPLNPAVVEEPPIVWRLA